MGTLKIERVSLMQVIESWNVSLPLQGFNCGQAILMFLSLTKDSDTGQWWPGIMAWGGAVTTSDRTCLMSHGRRYNIDYASIKMELYSGMFGLHQDHQFVVLGIFACKNIQLIPDSWRNVFKFMILRIGRTHRRHWPLLSSEAAIISIFIGL